VFSRNQAAKKMDLMEKRANTPWFDLLTADQKAKNYRSPWGL